ncbi:MAG TPA: NAD-dependent epimerase/dehydratase family protein [Kofleriaceae bacterium]
MKRAFVTGGSGFVGQHLIRVLVEKGVEVRALARSEQAAIAVRGVGAEPVRGDLDATPQMAEGMDGCDVVFHSAAKADEHGPLKAFMDANVGGTERTLAAAKKAQVGRFVHVSTEAVLADGNPLVRADETWPYPKKPMGPYAISKGAAERAVIAATNPAFDAVVIRPRFIWGQGDTSLLPKLAGAVRAGKFAWIDGGHYLTSTCHVANCCEGALLAAEKGRGGEVYFLTDGEPVDFRDFLTAYLATQGVDASKSRVAPRWLARAVASATAWLPTPPVTKTAVALVSHEMTVVDTKARTELGYVGVMTKEAGLAEMKRVPGIT